MAAVHVQDVVKNYGDVKVLDGLSMSVDRGTM